MNTPMTTLSVQAPAASDLIQLDLIAGAQAAAYSEYSFGCFPLALANPAVDTSTMAPNFAHLTLPPSADAAPWTFASTPAQATLTAFEATIATTGMVRWTVYAPGAATSLAFPALPADLAAADPSGGAWQGVDVALGVFVIDYASALRDIDTQWLGGPRPGVLFASGVSMSTIIYTSSLGPP